MHFGPGLRILGSHLFDQCLELADLILQLTDCRIARACCDRPRCLLG
jgi:hypothetical protein